MIPKIFSNTINSLINPNTKEIQEAQEQAIERIQSTLFDAESEVARLGQVMTEEQRFNAAEHELKKTEEHLLLALGSLLKASFYVAPQLINRISITMPFSNDRKQHFRVEKPISAEIVE